MSCDILTFKRGATFICTCTTSQSIAGWGIASKARRENGDLVAVFDVEIVQHAPVGVFRLKCNDTTSWPLELLRSDILYTVGGRDVPTETFFINVIEMVSQ